jgi:hypothetical protein
MSGLKQKAIDYYEKNETKVDIAFFLGGFVFDIFTLSDIDDPLSVAQQLIYLWILGTILYFDFLSSHGAVTIQKRFEKIWNYRQLIFHFLLGSLLSVYSLFYLKSASFFSSIVFVVLIMGLMIANELKSVQKSEINIKVGLYIICVFSFFSMLIPVLMGFVGFIPFVLSLALTGGFIYGVVRLLGKRIQDTKLLFRALMAPGAAILALFLIFYVVGWIPPVPLSVQNMGVYHSIEKAGGDYILTHEKPWWKFWQTGDQDFKAEPGDKIHFFAQIFSPARFSDSVILHWFYKDLRQGWMSTDKIPMQISGGRKNGYRGYATKANYADGEYRISVETTDGREIGRIYFEVKKLESNNAARVFQKDIF